MRISYGHLAGEHLPHLNLKYPFFFFPENTINNEVCSSCGMSGSTAWEMQVVFGACLTPELLCDSCHGNLDGGAAHFYSSSEK